MPDALLNGIHITWERSGSGRRLLYLNGSGATLASTGPLLSPFRKRFDVLAHDQRGLGLTEIPDGPATMADYAADAIALLDHVGWESCAVVGVSFGGMVAQELAVTIPDRVDRLALLCTSPGGPDTSSYPLHELAALSPEEREAIQVTLLDTRFDAAWLATHDRDRAIVDVLAQRNRVEKPAEQRRGEALQLAARAGHDVRDRLHRITCPTFVAAGQTDGTAPLGNSEAIVERVPTAELHVYEGGHLFALQDPTAVPELLDWLNRSDGGA